MYLPLVSTAEVKLSITLLASFLDSSNSWTQSYGAFPAYRSLMGQYTRSGRRGATLLENQTGEIIDKILIRLPPKDVGRRHVVTMSRRGMTSTPALLLELRHRQTSLPILDGHGQPASLVIVRDAGAHPRLWPFLPGSTHHSQDCLRGACDVFLIVSRYNQLYINKPVIRNRALMHQPQSNATPPSTAASNWEI